jgi:putative FmdB family regulatory protein
VPLYEYTCGACREGFTLLQSIHARPEETLCPACGAREATRRMSVFAAAVAGGPEPAPACGPQGGCGTPVGGCGAGMCGL